MFWLKHHCYNLVSALLFKACLHETWNSVARHKIWSHDTKFCRTAQNLVARHKIWSLGTKSGRTTQTWVVQHKLKGFNFHRTTQIWSHDTTKFVFCVNRPLPSLIVPPPLFVFPISSPFSLSLCAIRWVTWAEFCTFLPSSKTSTQKLNK
jgi:hypothetical protein